MSWNKNAGYGQALLNMVQAQVPTFGNILVVFNSSDSDEKNYQHLQEIMSPDYDGQIRFYTSLESAYDAAESNNNDVILLDANSSHKIANGIAWSKNRVHLIGMDGGDRLVQQGAKVSSTDGAADAYVIKVTGVRNSFRNIKFVQADKNAAALHVLEEGGEGNLYKNCSFTFGVGDNLDQTTAHEVVMGGDSCTFIDCLFGTETLLTSADRSVMDIDKVTTQECKSNIFKDCIWLISTSETLANLIRVRGASDVIFTNLFIRPIFMASVDTIGGVAVTDAVESVGGIASGTINLYLPGTFNCTNTCTTATAVEVYAPATSNNGHEAVTPA